MIPFKVGNLWAPGQPDDQVGLLSMNAVLINQCSTHFCATAGVAFPTGSSYAIYDDASFLPKFPNSKYNKYMSK